MRALHPRHRLRAIAVAYAVAAAISGCALPPGYPPDADHVNAGPAECFECHQRAGEPPMHPSHFEKDGRLKSVREKCHDCHAAKDANDSKDG